MDEWLLATSGSAEQQQQRAEDVKNQEIAEEKDASAIGPLKNASVRQRVSRLLLENCTNRVTNAHIQSLQALCTTLCLTADDVREALSPLEDEIRDHMLHQDLQQVLKCWYLIDGIVKAFRSEARKHLLAACMETISGYLEMYVPWKSRQRDPKFLAKFDSMFKTWRHFAPQTIYVTIANLSTADD